MTDARTIARLGLSGVAVAETAATWTRWEQRRRLFQAADARAREQGRPLLVVLPRKEGWFNRSMRLFEYGARYTDIFRGRKSPVLYADTLAGGVKTQSDSAVLYVACVLEYVTDLRRTMDEIMRIAGERENIYIVNVQPWTLTAALHPSARWAGIADAHTGGAGHALMTLPTPRRQARQAHRAAPDRHLNPQCASTRGPAAQLRAR